MNAFSAFVSTLKEDLQAIQGDLNEFVTTVREDASAVLGVDLSAPPPNTGRFEDLLRERPELLCERTLLFSLAKCAFLEKQRVDVPRVSASERRLGGQRPRAQEGFVTRAHLALTPLAKPQKDEIEKLLGGLDGPLIPELYREFVPSRVTHQEFFERLFYFRAQHLSAARLKMQGSLNRQADAEELHGWDDDDEEEEEQQDDDDEGRKKTMAKRHQSDEDDPIAGSRVDQEVARLQKRVAELERALEASERKREDLERQLAAGKKEMDGASTKSWEAISGNEEVTTDTPLVVMNDNLGDWE